MDGSYTDTLLHCYGCWFNGLLLHGLVEQMVVALIGDSLNGFVVTLIGWLNGWMLH